jgi:CheY-like chemotaxis protein
MVLERAAQILLVEDSPHDVLFTQEAFAETDLDHDLHVVGDGEEAMAFLRNEGGYAAKPRPDLVLLDLNMPRKDGREVLAELKGDPVLRDIPVVVLTTSSAEEDIVRCYSAHANSYVRKPVILDTFRAAVQSIGRYWFSFVTLPQQG